MPLLPTHLVHMYACTCNGKERVHITTADDFQFSCLRLSSRQQSTAFFNEISSVAGICQVCSWPQVYTLHVPLTHLVMLSPRQVLNQTPCTSEQFLLYIIIMLAGKYSYYPRTPCSIMPFSTLPFSTLPCPFLDVEYNLT